MEDGNDKKKQEQTDIELRRYALDKAMEWFRFTGRPVTLRLPLKLADVFYTYIVTGKAMDWSEWDSQ